MNPEVQETPVIRQMGFLAALSAVFWSFIGIRRRKDYESDAAGLSIAQVVVAGVIGGVIFVFGVLALVRVVIWNLGSKY